MGVRHRIYSILRQISSQLHSTDSLQKGNENVMYRMEKARVWNMLRMTQLMGELTYRREDSTRWNSGVPLTYQ